MTNTLNIIIPQLCILNLSKLSNQSSNDSMADGVYEVEFNMIQHKIVPDLISDPPKDKLHVMKIKSSITKFQMRNINDK